MKVEDEERIAADLAKIMAMICIRNSRLEDLHAGTVPTTRTGDYSDREANRCQKKPAPLLLSNAG